MKKHSAFILLISFFLINCTQKEETRVTITINDSVIAPIDHEIFGQFLEKPSWHGEWGPEAALVQGTNKLQDGVVEIMQDMNIPVLRFPGGTDVNFQDWTTMIDNAPGREGPRPVFVGHSGDTVTNMFGYDEACRLAEQLDAEMMLVINFGDAYFERKPLEEAVMHEAGLLAYCNSEIGAELPEGMPNWPAVRAENGHPEPYDIKYIQVVNEPWVMDRKLKRMEPIDEDVKEQYFKCMEAFIGMFKKIDPDIKIIADGNSKDVTLPLQEKFGDEIDFLSYHIYKPWGINKVMKGEQEIEIDSLTDEEVWKAWVAVPEFNTEGYSVLDNDVYNMVKQTNYPIAVTEWNWNGWWGQNSVNQEKLGSHFIKGVGAAGFIHALMREGNSIKIANQSMLVGKSWGITGMRVSPTGEFPPHPYPTGQVTGLYASHHGNVLLDISIENMEYYNQPYKMSGIQAVDKIAYLDILATKNDKAVYLHVINRYFSEDISVKIDFNGFETQQNNGIHWTLEGNLKNVPCKEGSLQTGCFSEKSISLEDTDGSVTLPKRSISILEFPLN
jgi:alpha-L-arabinofuranosidase